MTLIVDIGQQDLGETYIGYTTTNVSAVVEQVEIACSCNGLAFASLSQWLKWSCEAGEGSPDEARLKQTPYPFTPN